MIMPFAVVFDFGNLARAAAGEFKLYARACQLTRTDRPTAPVAAKAPPSTVGSGQQPFAQMPVRLGRESHPSHGLGVPCGAVGTGRRYYESNIRSCSESAACQCPHASLLETTSLPRSAT